MTQVKHKSDKTIFMVIRMCLSPEPIQTTAEPHTTWLQSGGLPRLIGTQI